MTPTIPSSTAPQTAIDGAAQNHDLQSPKKNSPPRTSDFYSALLKGDAAKIDAWIQNEQIDDSIWDSTYGRGETPLTLLTKSPNKYTCATQFAALIKMAPPRILDQPNTAGLTPLMNAARSDNPFALLHLAMAGANPNIGDREGETALMTIASQGGNEEAIRYLCRNGAHVNAQDKEGQTALHHAVFAENKSMIPLLIAAGADINMKDSTGFSALEYVLPVNQEEDEEVDTSDSTPIAMRTALQTSRTDMLAYVGSFFGTAFCADLLKASELMLNAVADAVEYAFGVHIETSKSALQKLVDEKIEQGIAEKLQ